MRLLRNGRPRLILCAVLLGLFFTIIPSSPATAAAEEPYLFRLGAGLQGVFPEFGYSAVLNLTKHSGVQGFFIYNDYAFIWGGKYLYRFLLRPTHSLYAYGLAGEFAFYKNNWDLIDTPGFIGGIVLEFTTSDFIGNLRYNLEIGYSTIGFPWGPPGPGLVYGGGIHFYLF